MTRFFWALGLVSHTVFANSGTVKIVSVKEISEFRSWKIVDSRSKEDFTLGRAVGSVRMDWKDWVEERPGLIRYFFGNTAKWGKVISDRTLLQNRLSDLGLTNLDTILVMGQPKSWGEEGRVAWNLLYWGAKEILLLDGGYPAWKEAGLPTENGPAVPAQKGNFQVHLRPQRRALLEEVKDALGKRQLLDARSPSEFAGEKVTGQKRGGHLSGAKLIPELSLYRSDGKYVDKEALKKLVEPLSQDPIAYCVGGVRSALLAVVLEARLGITTANYDGSIWEWSRDPSLPLIQP